jgi:hypothetical protein
VKEPAKLIVNSSTMLLTVMKETSFADVIVLSALCDVMSGSSQVDLGLCYPHLPTTRWTCYRT